MHHTTPRSSFLVPFRVRSFRFQWPADLLSSWAQEMEVLILNWYILMSTGSVVMLTLFASLQFLGTLLAPALGSLADMLGRRTVLCWLRASFAGLAAVLMVAGLNGTLSTGLVFAVAFVSGLIRPSDQVMRHAMIGDTMGPDTLAPAMGLNRLTLDSARIAGALAGAGLFATLGFGPAYVGVVAFYLVSLLLTLGTSQAGQYRGEGPFRIIREVTDGLVFTWRKPLVKALMLLAFLVNLCAFPINMGVLPFAAREVFGLDETGLAQLVAMFGTGALAGSLMVAVTGGPRDRGRAVVGYILAWFLLLIAFGLTRQVWLAGLLLGMIGYVQGIAMVTMSILLLEAAGPVMRSRVMGVRMLAVYGLPIGMAAGGKLVEVLGFQAMVLVYCAVGIAATVAITAIWRDALLGRA